VSGGGPDFSQPGEGEWWKIAAVVGPIHISGMGEGKDFKFCPHIDG